jgi:hypothetical protein
MTRGIVIIAQNTDATDYVKCAEILAKSIRRTSPNMNISLISDNFSASPVFDQVIKFPHGDLAPASDWKLINDWQVYEASPYDETLKLEADMFIPNNIDHWWDILSQQDVVISTTIRNVKNEISTVRGYRRFIDDNSLPDVYNALTYFKKSETAEKFFAIVRDVFENWKAYRDTLKCLPTEEVSTDWAYAIASHIIGREQTTMPAFTEFSMIHMKQFINGTGTEDWTDTYIYECFPGEIRVQTIPQLYPFHYHVKSFSDKISL